MEYNSFTLHNYKAIPQLSKLTPAQIEAIEVVGRVLPFKTNNYVIDELINWGNIPDDPIFTLTFPRSEMLPATAYNKVKFLLENKADEEILKREIEKIRIRLNPNPAGQEYNIPMLGEVKLKGVQHKYRETVLFFPAQGQTCHAYCTFCFRWPQFSGMSSLKFHMKEADLLYQYLDSHKKVSDILFTGGDPMTMSASILTSYILPLLSERFSHIRTIRIGTKSLAYWPYRYLSDKDAPELLALFRQVVASGRNLAIQAHFNHPAELSTSAVKEAVQRIRNTGAQIRTQSPLLKHINDKSEIWSEMWRKQVDMNMIPYYMFVARDTGSKTFFELPLERCWRIFRDAYSHVSGVCRTVRGPSMSTEPGKIQIVGMSEVKGEKIFVLRFLQGKKSRWVDVPFFARYDPYATWFDQLHPAFGEEKFFFEK
ncbi:MULTISPECIES: KamA family radical SAM protein [Sanguibacteroides]|uniref:Lysine 2,3-aminomutase n=1 Tax=Sanguibacteroides justesenii TaxID=1547597 RepID=A0A0C3NIK5_9PORP|nr:MULTISPECIES: lysine 2,3-aminomutase [Sanguibacteroides]KIO43833.1 lysine 2,3-aminomutase [Sanguibacteroides justesenii]KIO45997.1 lysine 2,3-aminomutase [Sanguibacteroides justesenii]PXZ44879.1 lysine 2,3-aminomutase [Sanguibacteroides justesenii]